MNQLDGQEQLRREEADNKLQETHIISHFIRGPFHLYNILRERRLLCRDARRAALVRSRSMISHISSRGINPQILVRDAEMLAMLRTGPHTALLMAHDLILE